jgi:hypothetical protein
MISGITELLLSLIALIADPASLAIVLVLLVRTFQSRSTKGRLDKTYTLYTMVIVWLLVFYGLGILMDDTDLLGELGNPILLIPFMYASLISGLGAILASVLVRGKHWTGLLAVLTGIFGVMLYTTFYSSGPFMVDTNIAAVTYLITVSLLAWRWFSVSREADAENS